LDTIRLHLSQNGEERYSLTRPALAEIGAGESYEQTAVALAGPGLDAYIFKVSVTQTDAHGGRVTYENSGVVDDVRRVPAMVRLTTRSEPLAGGYATVNLCILNYSYTDVEVVANHEDGAIPGDIFLSVVNEDGLEISRAAYSGTPEGAYRLGGTTYAAIPGGGTLCVDVPVLVPAGLEEGANIAFVGGVQRFSAEDPFGAGALTGGALRGSLDSDIVLTPYYGTAFTDKTDYVNDEAVIISGQALDRESGDPQPDAALRIGFETEGYRWNVDVTTDDNGDYRYEFHPTPGLSGAFTAWAAHPDVFDVIDQARFTYHRFYMAPASGDIATFKGSPFRFRIGLYNPGTTVLDDFTVSFRAFTLDGDGEVEENRMQGRAIIPSGFRLDAGGYADLELEISPQSDAPDQANVVYTVRSAQGAEQTFAATVTLVPSQPALRLASPEAGYVDMTVPGTWT
jgi:hypothetical protein